MSIPYEPDFTILLDLFVSLVDSQADKPIDDGQAWQNDSQVLSLKLHRHLFSMRSLAKGATYTQGVSPQFIDHSSIKVLARAALETYLVFSYIYRDTDLVSAIFRHKCWQLGGLMDRQKLHTTTKDGARIQQEERQQIKRLRSELEQQEEFQALPLKHQNKLLKGEWRMEQSWADLGVAAGFHEKYFRNIYNYLCGYSHSSFISILQVGQARTIEDQAMLAKAIMGIGVVIMAHFSAAYVHLLASAAQVLSQNEKAAHIAEQWRFSADDMVTLYRS
ncbi:MAG: hypothetical protein H0V62_14535 [Gammaproteobacteria bacterium]|nr:hypothetical protein [Gammaproteobacteria bacterium]